MRASRFIKDIFTTGFSQVAVIVFGVLLLKLLAAAFVKSHFGLFGVVRRWDMVLLPLLTLNMSIGVARYVSYEKENGAFYLHFSMLVTTLLCILLFPALLIFPTFFSQLLFESPQYGTMVMILTLFLVANLLHLLVYSYFRGKLNMNAANLMRTLFFGFPLLPAGIAVLVKIKTGTFAPLSFLYGFFIAYSIWGIGISLFFIRKDFSLRKMLTLVNGGTHTIEETLARARSILTFSLSRIPAFFFSAMVLSFPVLYANHRISLEAAAYITIVVTVLRLFEVFSMPFNMILLPKFSSLKREQDSAHITGYSQTLLDFVFSFLPFCGVLAYGLIPFLILVWFGSGYMVAAHSVALAVLFSVFYLAFALIRGVLDGLFEFPYTNIISVSGFTVIGLFSLIIGKDTHTLTISFCAGLVTLGLVSVYLLIKKLDLNVPWFTLIKALMGATVVFLMLYFADMKVAGSGLEGLHVFLISAAYRLLAAALVWFLFWRKTTWYSEVIKRLGLHE